MRGITMVVAAALIVGLAAACGDDDVPTERGDGGTLPQHEDPGGMSAAEHRDAACDEIGHILRGVVGGQPLVHGDQLDYIISHTAAADDEALDEAANTWADTIADPPANLTDDEVVDQARQLTELCAT